VQGWYLPTMDRRLFDDLGRRIEEALRNSPREDFEVQKKLLDDALARLAALEARLAELESRKRAP
jgi:hypothetical protein